MTSVRCAQLWAFQLLAALDWFHRRGRPFTNVITPALLLDGALLPGLRGLALAADPAAARLLAFHGPHVARLGTEPVRARPLARPRCA